MYRACERDTGSTCGFASGCFGKLSVHSHTELAEDAESMSISSSSSSSLFAVDVDVDWLWGLAEDNGIDEVCAVSMFDGSDAGFISTAAAGFSKIISVLM